MRRLDITRKAHKQIGNLSKLDAKALYAALENLRNWPSVTGVKYIVNSDPKTYRLRVGHYRALLTVTEDAITIMEVKKRDEHTY